jgi:DNA-binding NarL/FixJ family response regulator
VTTVKARILLADDHALVRHGLRMVLEEQPDLEVTAEAGDGIEAVRAGVEEDVDLAILDIAMPRMTGLHAARELQRRRPDLRVLMLSMHDNERYLREALKAGACGYVVKAVADRDLVEACSAALRGESFLYPGATSGPVRGGMQHAEGDVRRGWGDDPTHDDPTHDDPAHDDPLTARELEVLKLIAEGYSGRQIAQTLVISEKTVERHRANILEKLDVRGRVELTRYAIRRGLVEP